MRIKQALENTHGLDLQYFRLSKKISVGEHKNLRHILSHSN